MTARSTASAAQDVLNEWSRLAARTIEGQARLARDSVTVLRRAASVAEKDGPAIGRAYVGSVGREYGRYWTEASALGLKFADQMLTLAQQTAARLLQDIDEAGSTAPAAAAAHHVAVSLVGRLGSTVSTPITVANRHGTAQDVGFDIGTMTGGGSTFTPPVRLDPATLSLAPGEEGTVVLSLELAASLFRAGERYRCQVRLVGGDDLVLDVSVMVSPDA